MEVYPFYCRVCLDIGSKIPIFGDSTKPNISSEVAAFGNIILNENDEFPKNICKICLELLESAILFRKSAQLCDGLLKAGVLKKYSQVKSAQNENQSEDATQKKPGESISNISKPISESKQLVEKEEQLLDFQGDCIALDESPEDIVENAIKKLYELGAIPYSNNANIVVNPSKRTVVIKKHLERKPREVGPNICPQLRSNITQTEKQEVISSQEITKNINYKYRPGRRKISIQKEKQQITRIGKCLESKPREKGPTKPQLLSNSNITLTEKQKVLGSQEITTKNYNNEMRENNSIQKQEITQKSIEIGHKKVIHIKKQQLVRLQDTTGQNVQNTHQPLIREILENTIQNKTQPEITDNSINEDMVIQKDFLSYPKSKLKWNDDKNLEETRTITLQDTTGQNVQKTYQTNITNNSIILKNNVSKTILLKKGETLSLREILEKKMRNTTQPEITDNRINEDMLIQKDFLSYPKPKLKWNYDKNLEKPRTITLQDTTGQNVQKTYQPNITDNSIILKNNVSKTILLKKGETLSLREILEKKMRNTTQPEITDNIIQKDILSYPKPKLKGNCDKSLEEPRTITLQDTTGQNVQKTYQPNITDNSITLKNSVSKTILNKSQPEKTDNIILKDILSYPKPKITWNGDKKLEEPRTITLQDTTGQNVQNTYQPQIIDNSVASNNNVPKTIKIKKGETLLLREMVEKIRQIKTQQEITDNSIQKDIVEEEPRTIIQSNIQHFETQPVQMENVLDNNFDDFDNNLIIGEQITLETSGKTFSLEESRTIIPNNILDPETQPVWMENILDNNHDYFENNLEEGDQIMLETSSKTLNESQLLCANSIQNLENYINTTVLKDVTICQSEIEKYRKYAEILKGEICPFCSTKLNGKLQQHMYEAHNLKKTVCRICLKHYPTVYLLYDHVKEEHKLPAVVCPVCGKIDYNDMLQHIRIHGRSLERLYVCQHCGKQIGDSGTFNKHIKIHTRKLPHKCSLCPYRGRLKACLRIHMRRHTGERPYKCNVCDRYFITASCLKVHEQKHKGHAFFCDRCNQGFFSNSNLKKHIKVKHMGLRDYVCKDCGCAFGYRHGLRIHEIKVHNKEKGRKGRRPVYLQLQDQGLLPE